MRLAVTVGFDATFVVKALSTIGPVKELYLLRGVTGGEGDERSRRVAEDVVKVLGRGRLVDVDLRSVGAGLRQLYQLEFDAVALAGGPRLLVVLAFFAALLKESRVYVVPEFSADSLDLSPLALAGRLLSLSDAKLRALAAVDGLVTPEELARRLGVDVSTAYRHLEGLAELGVVSASGRRSRTYSADPLLVEVGDLILQERAKRRGVFSGGNSLK